MSAGCIEATGNGSISSSTSVRRVMLPVCQCSSWRPVISTNGYSASGGSAPGMIFAGTKRALPGRRRESLGEHDALPGVAFLFARISHRVLGSRRSHVMPAIDGIAWRISANTSRGWL